ncbi:MAG: hypothetical protein AAF939_07885 [Planctomycetota bacterium]
MSRRLLETISDCLQRSIFTFIVASMACCCVGSLVSAQETSTVKTELELYASLDQAVGNIAFIPSGQLVFSHHPFFKPEIRVATYDALGIVWILDMGTRNDITPKLVGWNTKKLHRI